MYCFQCQETAKNSGCTVRGVCGKPESTANLQDLLIYVLKGISVWGVKADELGVLRESDGLFVAQGLFATITNANWDDGRFVKLIGEAVAVRDDVRDRFKAAYRAKNGSEFGGSVHDCATWNGPGPAYAEKAP
ncbi:MAG: hydroxylamine reductase, partial [Dethiosulfovibrio sp.]|nr:hydroxylamine reductase [Dethiosulfovibrio sp.]